MGKPVAPTQPKERRKTFADFGVGEDTVLQKIGSLRFPSSNRPLSKWCKVSTNVKGQDIHNVARIWGLGEPNVIISVTGGAAGNLGLTSKLDREFKKGLKGAVKTTGAWVITGGTSAVSCQHSTPTGMMSAQRGLARPPAIVGRTLVLIYRV